MSSFIYTKFKHCLPCYFRSQCNAFEKEIDQQKNIIRGLEHDIEKMNLSLSDQNSLHHDILNNAEIKTCRLEKELKDVKQSGEENVHKLQIATLKFEAATETIKELKDARTEDKRKMSQLVDGVQTIKRNELKVVESIKSVCEAQEQEIRELKDLRLNKDETGAVLHDVIGLLKKNSLIDTKNTQSTIDNETMGFDAMLLLLKETIEEAGK